LTWSVLRRLAPLTMTAVRLTLARPLHDATPVPGQQVQALVSEFSGPNISSVT